MRTIPHGWPIPVSGRWIPTCRHLPGNNANLRIRAISDYSSTPTGLLVMYAYVQAGSHQCPVAGPKIANETDYLMGVCDGNL